MSQAPSSSPLSHLSVVHKGSTAILTFQRPPANALNHDVMRELLAVLRSLPGSSTRALVLTGQGRFFSAGLDLFEVFQYSPDEAEAFSKTFDDAITALFALELPVVAALNGHAIAGGGVLAAAADFRFFAEGEGKLGLTEIQVGVPFPTSAFETVRFAYAGPHFAELIYRGKNYSAAECLARHFVDEIVPAAELIERATALAGELGSRPPIAFSSSKLALRKEGLARMAAARTNGGVDSLWTKWRTPEVFEAMMKYRASLKTKSS